MWINLTEHTAYLGAIPTDKTGTVLNILLHLRGDMPNVEFGCTVADKMSVVNNVLLSMVPGNSPFVIQSSLEFECTTVRF